MNNTAEQLVAAAQKNADIIYNALGGDRVTLNEVLQYVTAVFADYIERDKGLVEATEFLFQAETLTQKLVQVAEAKVVTEFADRPDELLEQIMQLQG
jgi:hypothetical protein